MKTEDIDKRIGMPDVDDEWAKFESEIIDKPTTSRKPLYWGIGIAASIALVAGIFLTQTPTPNPSRTGGELSQISPQHDYIDAPSVQGGEKPTPNPTCTGGGLSQTYPQQDYIDTPPVREGKGVGVQEMGVSSELGIYSVEEQMPQFPGGSRALLDFIAANMRYPDLAMEYGARGRVISTFLIDSLGNVKDIKVMRYLRMSYDTLRLSQETEERQALVKEQIALMLGEESLRILNMMPTWIPGKQMGKPVNVRYTVPIQFKATEEERQTFLAQRENNELEGRIAGLNIEPSSAELGSNAIRVAGSDSVRIGSARRPDSILVVVNGQPLTIAQSELRDIDQHFFDRQQRINNIYIYKDEEATRPYIEKFGELAKYGVIVISTTPFTLVAQLSPEQLKARRKAYLLNSYRKGFVEDANRLNLAPDLFDTDTKERLFGRLTQQYGRVRREYFGPVGSDAKGVYVPLIREAVISVSDIARLRDGKIESERNLQIDSVLTEIGQVAAQADDRIARTDSVVRKAFIFGGTIAETEPRSLNTLLLRNVYHFVQNTTFRFRPDADAPSFWWAEIYQPTSGQRRVDMHLHSVDKLYASDCPEILANRRKVEGMVLNELDEPMADAIVSVGNSTATETVQVKTDSTGHFELWLPFSNASIRIDHIGHVPVYLNQPSDTAIIVRMNPSTIIKDVKVPVKKKGNDIAVELKFPFYSTLQDSYFGHANILQTTSWFL